MTTPLDLEIRSRVAAVLAGDLSLRDFYRWFVPETWEVSLADGEEAVRLTHQLTHLFSELTAEILTPGEVRRELELALSTYSPTQTPWNHPPAMTITTGSMNDITEDSTPVFVLGAPRVAARAS